MSTAGDSGFALNGTGRNTRRSPMARAVTVSISRRLRGGRPISTSTLPERGIPTAWTRYSCRSRAPITEIRVSIHRGVGRTGSFWTRLFSTSKRRLPDPRMKPARSHTVGVRSGKALRISPTSIIALIGLAPGFLPRQHPEEDDPSDAPGGARVPELRGEDLHLAVELRVGAEEPHREVRRVDPLGRAPQDPVVEDVPLDDLRGGPRRKSAEAPAVGHEDPEADLRHREELEHQAPAEVARRHRQEDAGLSVLTRRHKA